VTITSSTRDLKPLIDRNAWVPGRAANVKYRNSRGPLACLHPPLPPVGPGKPCIRFLHALSAAWRIGLFRSTPELRSMATPDTPAGLRVGSGKLGSPCERMHCEYSRALELLGPVSAPDEVDEPNDEAGWVVLSDAGARVEQAKAERRG